jgi:formate hydrogenlyase subunit 3/multisubunit Na+/H+ antiporter MnhD subunit
MTIFLLSLTGIPPLAGFAGKFYLFSDAIKGQYYWLAVIGMLNSAVSAYYYLRVLMYMYFKEPVKELGKVDMSPAYVVVMLVSVGALLYLGIFPRGFMHSSPPLAPFRCPGRWGEKASGRHAGTADPRGRIATFGALFAGRPRTYAKYSPRPTLLRFIQISRDRFFQGGKNDP